MTSRLQTENLEKVSVADCKLVTNTSHCCVGRPRHSSQQEVYVSLLESRLALQISKHDTSRGLKSTCQRLVL